MPDLFDSCKIAPVTECILSHLMQADQANMASASAVLGLLPTVLSMMGSSTVDIGLLAVRRPGLAIVLACGSPAINPLRTFVYNDPKQTLQLYSNALKPPTPTGRLRVLVSVLEELMGLGAYQLSLRTVLSMSEETMYLQGIWALGTVPIHIFGCSVLLGCALCVGACLSILTPAVVRLYIHDFRHLFSPLLRS